MPGDITRDLPQASSLPKVRAFVRAVAAGKNASLRTAGVAAGLSARHADYYGLAATVTLGLAETHDGRLRVTALGSELLATPEGGYEERGVFRRAISESQSVTSIAPDLIEPEGPSVEALTKRLVVSGLSPATARRRASTLLAWRKYVLARQARLPIPLAKVQPELTSEATVRKAK
jgi:hypothetical protein